MAFYGSMEGAECSVYYWVRVLLFDYVRFNGRASRLKIGFRRDDFIADANLSLQEGICCQRAEQIWGRFMRLCPRCVNLLSFTSWLPHQ